MFGWEFPPHNSGGLGVACKGIADSLVKEGVEVIFVLPKRMDVYAAGYKMIFANVPNMKVIGVNSLLHPYVTSQSYGTIRDVLRGNVVYGEGLLAEVLRYAELAAEIAKTEQFDVIHAHDWLSFGAGLVAKEVSGKPLIAHVHATEVDRTAGNVNQMIYDIERMGVLAADRVVSVSDFTKRILVERYGVDPSKINVVHNGIDPAEYSLDEPPDRGLWKLKEAGYKIVLYFGRITVMKGVDHLISAARRVLEWDKKIMFVIAGSGDMEGQIMEQAANLGISKNVMFPGFLRGVELSSVIRAADVFVTPSISEPFGLTPLESLAHGTPVIISKQSGVSEVLQHAIKVDFWDELEMADQILSVLEYGSMKHTLSSFGHDEAMKCTWGRAAGKLLTIYNSLQ